MYSTPSCSRVFQQGNVQVLPGKGTLHLVAVVVGVVKKEKIADKDRQLVRMAEISCRHCLSVYECMFVSVN